MSKLKKSNGSDTIMVVPAPKASTPTPTDSRPMTPVNVVEKSSDVRLQIEDDRAPFPKSQSPKVGRLRTPPKKADDLETTECPFTVYGCDFRADRHEVKKHIRDFNTTHISLLCENINPTKRDIIEKIETSDNVKFRETIDCSFRMTSINHLYSCQFVWPITEYAEKLRAAKKGITPVIHSPPFLTHRSGYKICVMWAPFGDGDAVREHCSVFVSILRGDHDSILTWPFRCPITFKLIDQSKDKKSLKHVVDTLSPSILDANAAFLGRPKATRNHAFGILKFVPMDEMQNGGRYFKNDVVYLGVDIDLSEVPAF